MATREELEATAKEAKQLHTVAEKAFTALRADGSAEELVKAAGLVTKSKRTFDKAQHDADTFELVAVYEGIRASALPIAESIDMAMLAKHEVKSVTITVPVSIEAPVTLEAVTVNTLGKRTVIKSGNGTGTRTRYVYGPEKLNSREVVEQHGIDEVGEERRDATLAEPSKHGLTHLADRIAKKLEWEKVPA